jgi:small subunit ribosomal protein S18
MANKPARGQRSRDAAPRKFKKKTSPIVIEKVEYVDYKNVDLLTRFMTDRGKIRNQKMTGNDVQQQREVANAIKIAREMGLLPYARRVASASRGGRPGRDGDRRPRRDEEQVNDQVTEQTGDETTDDLAVATVGGDEGEEA